MVHCSDQCVICLLV